MVAMRLEMAIAACGIAIEMGMGIEMGRGMGRGMGMGRGRGRSRGGGTGYSGPGWGMAFALARVTYDANAAAKCIRHLHPATPATSMLQLPQGDDVKSEAEARAVARGGAEQLQLQIANGTGNCAHMSCDPPLPPSAYATACAS